MSLKNTISKGIRDMFFIWHNEMKKVFKDTGVIIFFFLVPFAYPLLYSIIYNQEVVEEVPLVVVDDSKSSLSREFVRKIDGSSEVKVAGYCSDMEEARTMVDEKKAYGVLYIPSGFSKDLNKNDQTSVSLYCDMGSLLYYKAFLLVTTEVSLDMGKEIQLKKMDGMTAKTEDIVTRAVPYENVPLYNTQNGFASFLVPAILVLVIQQTLLLGIGMLAATEREKNRFGHLIPADRHHGGTLRIVLGKSLAYLLIYIPVCIWALLIILHIFSLPQIARPGLITLFTLPYLCASIFFAMIVSCFMKERESPMLFLVFTSVPLLFLSGVSWPLSAIPDFWKWVSYIFPSTFGIQGFIKINSMGASISEVAFEYKMLWIQTGIYFLITCLIYRWQIIQAAIAKKHKLEEMRQARG